MDYIVRPASDNKINLKIARKGDSLLQKQETKVVLCKDSKAGASPWAKWEETVA